MTPSYFHSSYQKREEPKQQEDIRMFVLFVKSFNSCRASTEKEKMTPITAEMVYHRFTDNVRSRK